LGVCRGGYLGNRRQKNNEEKKEYARDHPSNEPWAPLLEAGASKQHQILSLTEDSVSIISAVAAVGDDADSKAARADSDRERE